MLAEGTRQQEEQRQRHGRRKKPMHASIGRGEDGGQCQHHKHHDIAELWLVLDAGQGIGRHAADDDTDCRGDNADDD